MDSIEELLGAPFDPELVPEPVLEPVRPERETSAMRLDRVRGMLLGVCLGDALGAPHEFRNQTPLEKYSGVIEHPLWVCRRFQGGRLTGSVGQTTDDTEMTIALATALLKSQFYQSTLVETWVYDRDTVIAAYLAWAASKCPFLGFNTRKLFVGVKTLRGYQSRWDAQRALPVTQWSCSNGCLMRSSPLALLSESEWRLAAAADCTLTNFHPICVTAVTAYVRALRELLDGASPTEATARALTEVAHEDIAAAIAAGRDQRVRDVTFNKGWVVHAIYCAFLALNDRRPGAPFQDRIDRIIRLSGDTDTNGAIAGALLGAHCGEHVMRAESRTGPNIQTLLECDVSVGPLARPELYTARRLMEMAEALANLS